MGGLGLSGIGYGTGQGSGRVVVGQALVSERSYSDAMLYTYEGRVLEHGVFETIWGKVCFCDRMDKT